VGKRESFSLLHTILVFRPKEHEIMSNTQGESRSAASTLECNTLSRLFSTHPIDTMNKTTGGLCAGPILIGHRGASLEHPENTIPSFARALELGADMLELDVRLSKDGQVVVIHDPMVDRTTDGKGLVNSFTLAELKALKTKGPTKAPAYAPESATVPNGGLTGVSIATLEEVFQALPEAVIAVEIKDDSWPLCLKVVELIKRYDRFERTTIELIAIKGKLAKALRKFEPRLTTGHTTAEIVRFVALSKLRLTRLFKARGAIFEVPLKKDGVKIVTRSFVRAAHKKGIRVLVWTVNDAGTMARLFKMGVDGIFTDDLVLARTVAEHIKLLGK
jgi:glycerophosphoryl diester phosphodiesterase